MAHRYFTSDIHGDTARITGPDAVHLAKVLRAKPGEILTLCDGEGTDYTAEITAASPAEVLLRVLGSAPTAAEPALWAEVYLGYAKGERMEWAVQKCVELGASAIQPFYSKNTVVKPGDAKREENKAARLSRIAAEAAKQAGRGRIPQVAPPLPFAEALAGAAKMEQALFLYEKGGVTLQSALAAPPKSVAILTGAEGGFTPEEAEAAGRAGCTTVHLGPRILRCETAPVATLAAVMALTGNLE